MQGHHRPIYAQRLNKDIAELFNYNFDCSASSLTVKQTADSWNVPGSIVLMISIIQGPYRGGVFSFHLEIPENYPFKAVVVWACHSIWHPNIQLASGKVALPLEWSPVITLKSVAMAVQMLMLEPSCDNPLNLEAYSNYMRGPEVFDGLVQKYLRDSHQARHSYPVNSLSSGNSSSNNDASCARFVPSPRKRAFRDVEDVLEVEEGDTGHYQLLQQQYLGSYADSGAAIDECSSVAMSVNSQPSVLPTASAVSGPFTVVNEFGRSVSHSPINSEMYKMSISPEEDDSSNIGHGNSYRVDAYKRRKT